MGKGPESTRSGPGSVRAVWSAESTPPPGPRWSLLLPGGLGLWAGALLLLHVLGPAPAGETATAGAGRASGAAVAGAETASSVTRPAPASYDEGTPSVRVESDAPEITIEVHEGYELANVAIALHPVAEEVPWLVLQEGPYWEDVERRFGGFAEEPAVARIPMEEGRWVEGYYAVRNGGYRWRFEDRRLVLEKSELFWGSDGFEPLRSDFERFARRSDFRRFFRDHRSYFDDVLDRYGKLVDLERMARWLEAHFPRTSIDRYVVVLSPLVYGSHNTRTVRSEGVTEAYMFVAGPDSPVDDHPPGYRVAVNERIVFTEIDHNYVNPETDRVRGRVRRLLGGELERWNRSESYRSAYATFNEYMTWSVYLLYAREVYSPAVHDVVRARVTHQMEERRGFPLFGTFHDVVEEVYRARPAGTPFAALYPRILERLATGGLPTASD